MGGPGCHNGPGRFGIVDFYADGSCSVVIHPSLHASVVGSRLRLLRMWKPFMENDISCLIVQYGSSSCRRMCYQHRHAQLELESSRAEKSWCALIASTPLILLGAVSVKLAASFETGLKDSDFRS
uniref:Uncharacterized protein n=1 Tax=Schistocephalus solidus TaxID=70667 RepID=A0A0X3P6Y4_SCHSO